MEEKKLTPEEIEVLKAAKVLHNYCSEQNCGKCVFFTEHTNHGLEYVGCAIEDALCPQDWPLDTMPIMKEIEAPEDLGE